jgi:hypothetical protein
MRKNWMRALGLFGVGALIVGCGGGPATDEASAPAPMPAAQPAPAHVGTWELDSVELRDAAGAALPAPDGPALGQAGAVGRLIFDNAGHFGLAIMEQGRPKYADPTPEQAVADLHGYTALFGTYALEDGGAALAVRFGGGRDPGLTGTTHSMPLSVAGDGLTLELPASASGVTATTVWQRMPDMADLTPTHQQVIGFWQHVPNAGDTRDNPPLRPGFIIYTAAGQMMVHLMAPNRPTHAGAQPTPAEAQATVASYTSYFGPFTVDEAGSYFIHHRIGHTLDLTDQPKPERRTGLDTDAQRFYEFVDNRLVLRFLTTAGVQDPPAGDDDWNGMITWQRLTPAPG